MKIVEELVDQVKRGVAQTPPEGVTDIGNVRVDITHLEQLTLAVHCHAEKKDFSFIVDEPGYRGGLGKGPDPLEFFTAGAGA